MAFLAEAICVADQPYQGIARSLRIYVWARLIVPAAAIVLASRNSRHPDARAFLASDRAVTVPHAHRRASECFSGGYDCDGGQEQEAHSSGLLATNAIAVPIQMGSIARLAPPNRCSAGSPCF